MMNPTARNEPDELSHRTIRPCPRALLAVGVVWAMFCLSGGCGGGFSRTYDDAKLTQLQLAPITASARPTALADLAGKVTVINFWATWCGPCVQEFPHLLRLADAHRDHTDFLFLSVAGGHPDSATLRRETQSFLQRKGYDLPVYEDVGDVTRRGLSGVPQGMIPLTLLLDREGKVAQVIVGYDSSALDQMGLTIASMLRSSPPTP